MAATAVRLDRLLGPDFPGLKFEKQKRLRAEDQEVLVRCRELHVKYQTAGSMVGLGLGLLLFTNTPVSRALSLERVSGPVRGMGLFVPMLAGSILAKRRARSACLNLVLPLQTPLGHYARMQLRKSRPTSALARRYPPEEGLEFPEHDEALWDGPSAGGPAGDGDPPSHWQDSHARGRPMFNAVAEEEHGDFASGLQRAQLRRARLRRERLSEAEDEHSSQAPAAEEEYSPLWRAADPEQGHPEGDSAEVERRRRVKKALERRRKERAYE